MMIFVAMDFLFAGCGGLLLGFSLSSEHRLRESPTVNNVAQNLLLDQCPLTGTTPRAESKRRIIQRYAPMSNGAHLGILTLQPSHAVPSTAKTCTS
jgi:hypothetical protein